MDIFTALADPNRRKIIELLARSGELSATEISAEFAVSAPAISQHLKVLREANLVQVEKRGQQRIYRVNAGTLQELESWARQMTQRWNERFDLLEQVLEQKLAEEEAAANMLAAEKQQAKEMKGDSQ